MKKRLQNLIAFHKENSSISKAFMILSCFLALAVTAPLINIIFELKPAITSFSSHVISNAALNDLDISKRVSYYYRGLFSILFLTILFYFLFYKLIGNSFKSKNEVVNARVITAISTASLVGIFSVICSYFIVNVDISIYLLAVICIILLANLKLRSQLDFDLALWPVLIAFPLSQYLFIFFYKHDFYGIVPSNFNFKAIPIPVNFTLIIYALIFLIVSTVLYVFIQKFFPKDDNENFIKTKNVFLLSFIPVLVVPILFSILIEVTNILNVRFGIVFNNPFILYTLLFLAAFASAFVIYKKKIDIEKYNNNTFQIIEKYYFPLLIIGFLLVIEQPWRLISPDNEFFETANHGLAIDHFFRYGSIPFVENFDAHMFSGQIFAYLYGFLNGYEPWAPFLYITYFKVIETLIVYYIFKRVLNSYTSFLLVLFLPIISVISNEFISSGLLALFIIVFLNNKSTRNYYVFWAVSLFLCLYKLDIGFAATIAGILTLLIVDYYRTRALKVKKLAITGAISGSVLLGVFCILCLVKGINPFDRFSEFLLAATSNQNWAVTRMGDVSNIAFRLAYYILPIITILFLGFILSKLLLSEKFKASLNKNNKLINTLIFFFFFSLFFLFNAPRGIVRHNYEYGNIIRITSTIPLVLLMFVLLTSRTKTLFKILCVFIVTFLAINSTEMSLKNKRSSILSQEILSSSFQEKFLEMADFNGTRVRESFDFSEFKSFKKIVDALLKPDETYFDFSSKNYFYALTERKNPNYLNQIPLMINGDRGQDLAIERIKNAKVPIVLMPIKDVIWSSVDEVYVDYKYYKIAEYIYANYTPLFRTASFDIYAIKDKKSKYSSILAEKGFLGNQKTITDFNFLTTAKVNKSNLQISVNQSGKAEISNVGVNAFFGGMISALRSSGQITDNNGLPTNLSFNITSASVGTIKIYYNLNPEDSYSEERVMVFPVEIGTSDILANFPKLPSEIMVAINVPALTINNFSASTITQDSVSKPAKLEYWLLNVPRIWAELDNSDLYKSVKALPQPLVASYLPMDKSEVINFQKPYYVYIEATSDAEISAKIDLVDNKNVLASFNFNVRPGTHSYAVRVSANYYWWHASSTSKISFSAETPLKISKYAMISDDAKEIYNYKPAIVNPTPVTQIGTPVVE